MSSVSAWASCGHQLPPHLRFTPFRVNWPHSTSTRDAMLFPNGFGFSFSITANSDLHPQPSIENFLTPVSRRTMHIIGPTISPGRHHSMKHEATATY